jgi:RimJ/RimL family protein N-acetyltransferase
MANKFPAAMELPEYTIRLVEPNDEAEIHSLFESDPGYFEVNQGAPASEVQSLVAALPEGKDYGDKFAYAFFDGDDALAAVIDLVRDYPQNGIWFLGLLFVAPWTRNVGLGTRILDAIFAHVTQQGGCAVRLGVVRGNIRARALYERMAFRFLYDNEVTRSNGSVANVDVLERTL